MKQKKRSGLLRLVAICSIVLLLLSHSNILFAGEFKEQAFDDSIFNHAVGAREFPADPAVSESHQPTWRFGITNRTGLTIKNIVIVDTPDKKLYLQNVSWTVSGGFQDQYHDQVTFALDTDSTSTEMPVRYLTSEGLFSPSDEPASVFPNAQQGLYALTIRFSDQVTLQPGEELSIVLHTKFRNPESLTYDPDQANNNVVRNHAAIMFEAVDSEGNDIFYKGPASDQVEITAPTPAESITETTPPSTTEPTSQPTPAQTTEPTAEPEPTSTTVPTSEPTPAPTVVPTTEQTTETTAEITTETTAEQTTEPTTEPTTSEPTTQPVPAETTATATQSVPTGTTVVTAQHTSKVTIASTADATATPAQPTPTPTPTQPNAAPSDPASAIPMPKTGESALSLYLTSAILALVCLSILIRIIAGMIKNVKE